MANVSIVRKSRDPSSRGQEGSGPPYLAARRRKGPVLRTDERKSPCFSAIGGAVPTTSGLGTVQCAIRCGPARGRGAQLPRGGRAQSDHPSMLASLANALRLDGQLEPALECSRRALAIDARQPLAHNNAGVILAARGEREQAIGHFRAALAVQPRYAEALTNLGTALWQEGQRYEAVEAFEQAAALVPGHPDSQYALGHLLLQLRRTTEAAERFRTTLRLAPAHTPAQLSLAAALRVLGQHEEAEAEVRAALAREPASAGALALLGELLADKGDFEQARAQFRQALAADPKCAMAYAGIAAHGRMSEDPELAARGAAAGGLRRRPGRGNAGTLRARQVFR